MGIKEMILLFIALFEFSSLASLIPSSKNMVSIPEHLPKNIRDEGMEEVSSFRNGAKRGGLVSYNAFAHGSGGGHGEGGNSVGTGQNGNGGQSSSPNTQAGSTSAVIPVYAAGAAAGRRNNHNAGTCSQCPTCLTTLTAGMLVYMFINAYLDRDGILVPV